MLARASSSLTTMSILSGTDTRRNHGDSLVSDAADVADEFPLAFLGLNLVKVLRYDLHSAGIANGNDEFSQVFPGEA